MEEEFDAPETFVDEVDGEETGWASTLFFPFSLPDSNNNNLTYVVYSGKKKAPPPKVSKKTRKGFRIGSNGEIITKHDIDEDGRNNARKMQTVIFLLFLLTVKIRKDVKLGLIIIASLD